MAVPTTDIFEEVLEESLGQRNGKINSIELTKPTGSELSKFIGHINNINITMLPGDVDNMPKYVELVKSYGFNPVPHISVRNMNSISHIEDMLNDIKVKDILLIGGDRERGIGDVHTVMEVIDSGILEKCGIKKVAVAGFPESPIIALNLTLQKVLNIKKHNMIPYIITQMCFKDWTVNEWIKSARAMGIECDIHSGMSGPTSITSLIKIAMKCGVGNSIDYLKKNNLSIDYNYKELINGLIYHNHIVHIYSFNTNKTLELLKEYKNEKI